MNEELNYKLDKNGNVDAEYYIQKAHELRGLYLTALLTETKRKLKSLFHVKLPVISVDRPAHH